jgi:short-subunit dehydrogenase
MSTRALAVVTGASTGIGLELARQLLDRGYDLLVTADEPAINDAADKLRAEGGRITSVRADLATPDGVEELVAAVEASGVPVDALLVNAGVGVDGAFVATDLQEHLRLIGLNVTGAVHLAHRLLPAMVRRGSGRVLFTSSVVANIPGPYMSTYAASKSFLLSFAEALRTELEDSGVTVTALMPGATDTQFFERADMEDTKLGQANKDDPADVARDGLDAMFAGRDHVVPGSLKNHAQAAAGKLLPNRVAAAANRSVAKPGSRT